MDAIADRVFADTPGGPTNRIADETPSLLTVILDVNPLEWKKLEDAGTINLKKLLSSLLIMLNSHLALNSSNQVALYTANSFSGGAKLIYPKIEDDSDTATAKKQSNLMMSSGMYRQFRIIDGSILDDLNSLLRSIPDKLRNLLNDGQGTHIKGTLSGALSMALSYINKSQKSIDPQQLGLKSRILIISISDDNTLPYISIMNTIFAAQKMKISVDVCKLGNNSTFLQQASDATNGVYIYIKQPEGLIQYLTTALFIDPTLRPIIVLPTNTSIDFRASCFITNKVIDIGYVCSVCLCILSVIPQDEKCPTCHSKFDHNLITRLKRKPKVLPLVKKKRKLEGTNGAEVDSEVGSNMGTPVPN
ncbi:hypothetical protein CANARDRAFT_27559 [[Candida] arabinofermentans NRRL YB-2248]|uniref:General transcription and DNA repair factor IIH subunit TFB4 n=1 Tax=[Candida] arabinofermentans NRRL YB-2248 TaxID=983967 RepID=A0A1E4T3T8_9ASCO|nr:hypothetical protein CANARDRAFT_27559 [[Candida] arabinofermentans NRRL YB-2248]